MGLIAVDRRYSSLLASRLHALRLLFQGDFTEQIRELHEAMIKSLHR
jgi:hypothetical protein